MRTHLRPSRNTEASPQAREQDRVGCKGDSSCWRSSVADGRQFHHLRQPQARCSGSKLEKWCSNNARECSCSLHSSIRARENVGSIAVLLFDARCSDSITVPTRFLREIGTDGGESGTDGRDPDCSVPLWKSGHFRLFLFPRFWLEWDVQIKPKSGLSGSAAHRQAQRLIKSTSPNEPRKLF
jgi:hypothetical protein